MKPSQEKCAITSPPARQGSAGGSARNDKWTLLNGLKNGQVRNWMWRPNQEAKDGAFSFFS